MRKLVAKFLRKNAPVEPSHPDYAKHVKAAKRNWNATPRPQRAALKGQLS